MHSLQNTPQFRAASAAMTRTPAGTRWRDSLRGTNFQRFLLDA